MARRAAEWDPSTWVERYGDVLYRYALVRVHRPEVAEDLVQETLLAGIEARHRYRGESSELAYLKGIMRHKVADYFRSRGGPEEADRTPERFFDTAGAWRTPPGSWAVDPEAAMQQEELWRVFTKCLAALPKTLAAVFVLREIDARSTEEICKALGITATNLWVRLHRARLRLRHCLEVHWFGKGR